jgi:two-component system phosphate regulon sensor histidine kinase PhoR
MDTEDAGLQQNISQEDLRAILQEELSQKKISMPFKYSVYSQTKKKDVLFSDSTDTSQLHASPYKIYLSGSEGNFDELSVYFPDKRNYMLQSMAGIIGISGLLSLLAITGFIWLARMLSRQQKISAMKTQFINNMTHEFKTPLATTLVAASSLNNPKIYSDPEKIGYYTNLIKEENRLMNRQIETVLQAALLDKDKLLLKSEPLDLREIVQKAVEGLQFQIEQAKGTIRLSLQEQPAIISGDADHLQQVIANLVMNSLKYSERTPEIEIALNSSGKKYFLQVCDNGIGISRKDQKYIFDAFYRVNTGDVHTIKGFGLGLNYVKKIVEYHKGKITVESEPGKGSVFTLTFQRYE